MSWRETCPMDERLKFIANVLKGEPMTDACRIAGVSRTTGYKWWERYCELGRDGLAERSRAPLNHPNAVRAEIVSALVNAKRQHPHWGPEKLRDWLLGRNAQVNWPATSTMGEILKRHGLVKPRKARQRAAPYSSPFVAMSAPNAVWCIDFKGQFRTGDQRYCYPLTVSDGYSRYLLMCRGLPATHGALCRPWLERLFREYGLPHAIRSDNGSPFACTGLGGLSELSKWWVKLGILPERIEPGHPEQNGRHERLHRTLKQETALAPERDLSAQQRRFDAFQREYNDERPHQALDHRRPAQLYRASTRSYPRKVPEVTYPSSYEVRHVRHNGQFRWAGELVYASEVLAGEPLGLHQVSEHLIELYFGPLKLGWLDVRNLRILPVRAQTDLRGTAAKVSTMCPV